MERALHLFNEFRDIVEGKSRLYLPEIPGRNLEGLPVGRAAPACQPATQRFINDLTEGAPGAARFRLELGRDVIIQS